MSDYQEKFLEIEKSANILVDRLEDLKKATERHLESAELLNEARDDIQSLVTEICDLSKQGKIIIHTLKEIDTQKIISDIEKNNQINQNLFEQVISKQRAMTKLVNILMGLGGISIILSLVLIVLRFIPQQ